MGWRETSRWWVPAVFVAVVHYAVVCHWYPLVDDYFIFLRYADNGLAGQGLTFNAGGERVEGYTSFLYLVVVTGLRAVKVSPVMCARALNAILFAALPLAASWFAQKLDLAMAAAVMPLLVATNHALVVHATGGMESGLLTVLVLLALGALIRPPSRQARTITNVLFKTTILTHPKTILIFITNLL